MCLTDNAPGGVKFGQRIHGIWLADGNFYYPVTAGDRTRIHVGLPVEFGPIQK